MAEVLNTSFKSDTTRLFVGDAIANDYYLFVSGITNVDPVNSIKSDNDFLSKTLFGKKVATEDTRYMIRYYPWNTGDIYVQYDDTVDLEDEKFYAIVGPTNNDTGDYKVYKCLFNNYDSQVTTAPNYDPSTFNQIYETADGYVWKYMYSITLIEFEAYNALGYIPITGDFEVNPTPTTGGSEISDIFISNKDTNFGYVEERGGVIQSPFPDGTLIVQTFTEWSPIANYYSGQYIYLTNPNDVTNLYEIDTYTYNAVLSRAEIRVKGDPAFDGVASNASFKIFPRIQILGDGTGALAIPRIIDGRINSIDLLNRGSGYNEAIATVVDPAYDFDPEDQTTVDVRAEIRAVISPKDGHGFDLINELKCKHFLLYAYITGDDNNQIGATNTYNGVGIVKNPEFSVVDAERVIFDNRIAIVTDDFIKLEVNTIVTQLDVDGRNTFEATVHEIDETSNTVYIAEYSGPYPSLVDGVDAGFLKADLALDLSKNLLNATGQTIVINSPSVDNIVTSDYVQRTGKVYYQEDFFPLDRVELSREEFKIVLEF